MKSKELNEFRGYSVYNRLPPTYERRDDMADKWLRGDTDTVLKYVADYQAKLRQRMEEQKQEVEETIVLPTKTEKRAQTYREIWRLRSEGKKLREIAAITGYSIPAVCLICKKAPVE